MRQILNNPLSGLPPEDNRLIMAIIHGYTKAVKEKSQLQSTVQKAGLEAESNFRSQAEHWDKEKAKYITENKHLKALLSQSENDSVDLAIAKDVRESRLQPKSKSRLVHTTSVPHRLDELGVPDITDDHARSEPSSTKWKPSLWLKPTRVVSPLNDRLAPHISKTPDSTQALSQRSSFESRADDGNSQASSTLDMTSDKDFQHLRALADSMARRRALTLEQCLTRLSDAFYGPIPPTDDPDDPDNPSGTSGQSAGHGLDGDTDGAAEVRRKYPNAVDTGFRRDPIIHPVMRLKADVAPSALRRDFSFNAGDDQEMELSSDQPRDGQSNGKPTRREGHMSSTETTSSTGTVQICEDRLRTPKPKSHSEGSSAPVSRIPSPIYKSPLTVRRRQNLSRSLHSSESSPSISPRMLETADSSGASVQTIIRHGDAGSKDRSSSSDTQAIDRPHSALALHAARVAGSAGPKKESSMQVRLPKVGEYIRSKANASKRVFSSMGHKQ